VRIGDKKSPILLRKILIQKEHILTLANQHLEGNTGVFVTDIRIGAGNIIQVFIDGDKGITIDDCVSLSRAIESALDRNKEDFSLDVSSHGATSPLLLPRQYAKHIGRTLEIKLTDGGKAEGELILCNSTGVVLQYSVRENKPVGKGKITVTKQLEVPFANVKEARIKLKY